jgi:hypothetical protein
VFFATPATHATPGSVLTMRYRVYGAIVEAVREGRLHDGPFDRNDFAAACPDFGKGTHRASLEKHAHGNPGGIRSCSTA